MMHDRKIKFEFSKLIIALLIPTMLAAVTYITVRTIDLAELAIVEHFTGALPYLVAVVTPAWAAIATILGFYFNKAKVENLAKINKTDGQIGVGRDC